MAVETTEHLYNLTKFEEDVLNIVKQLLKKHKRFQFDPKFVDYCRKKLGTSEMEVYKAIYSFVQRKILVRGSSLTRDQVLLNPSRSRIYDTIKNQPGIHIRNLSTTLNINSSVIRLHLKLLELFNYIRTKSYPKLVLLFPVDFPETYDDYFFILKNENDRKIIQLLKNHQLTISELSSHIGLHHSTIQYHLEKLERLDLITRASTDHTTKYTFNRARLAIFTDFLESILSRQF